MWWVEPGGSKIRGNVYMLGLYDMQEACGASTNRTEKERSAASAPQPNSEATVTKTVPEVSAGTMKTPWLQHQEGSLVTVPWIWLDFLCLQQFSQLSTEKVRSQSPINIGFLFKLVIYLSWKTGMMFYLMWIFIQRQMFNLNVRKWHFAY